MKYSMRKVIKVAKNCRGIIVLNDLSTSYQLRNDYCIQICFKNESVACVKLLLGSGMQATLVIPQSL